MASLTLAEHELLAEVGNREWLHRPDRGGDSSGGDDDGNGSRRGRRSLRLVAASLRSVHRASVDLVSWLGWGTAWRAEGRIAYEEGCRDAALYLADAACINDVCPGGMYMHSR